MLSQSFQEVPHYNYEPGSHSHEWSTKSAIKAFQQKLIPLCQAVGKVLKADEMVVKIKSPSYVLGDLHGNYKDLMFFRKSFWGMGVDMSPSRFLFLGDYVDRGPHSVEVSKLADTVTPHPHANLHPVAYLFALKLMNPTKIFLLRGNHEFASQNGERHYDPCFLQNVEELFPKASAKKIWESFNLAFDWMPVAATIDEKIFCCHGGIPRMVQNDLQGEDLLAMINNLHRPLLEDQVEDTEDFLALDILWSDPATDKEEKNSDGWFAENERGGDIVVFGSLAVDAFTKETGCTHIIRAHQPPSRGIEYCKSARILTVFSSSHYCGGFNSAAIVLVADGRIRVATTKPVKRGEEEEEDHDDPHNDLIVEEGYLDE